MRTAGQGFALFGQPRIAVIKPCRDHLEPRSTVATKFVSPLLSS